MVFWNKEFNFPNKSPKNLVVNYQMQGILNRNIKEFENLP